jgi:hypothetical protein
MSKTVVELYMPKDFSVFTSVLEKKMKFSSSVTTSDLVEIYFSVYARYFNFIQIRNLIGCCNTKVSVKFITSWGLTYARTDIATLAV